MPALTVRKRDRTVAAVLDCAHPEDLKIAEVDDFDVIDQAIASATPQELARLEQPAE